MKNKIFTIFSLAFLLFFNACSETKTAAGGTEAESTIAVQIQLAGGATAKTRVRLLPENYLSSELDTLQWQSTDDSGFVEFENLEKGSYTLEARLVKDENGFGAVMNFSYDSAVSIIDTLELSKLSAIEGYVPLGQGPSVIRIPGLDRFIIPDSAGHFVIDSLPEGDFNILVESRSNRGTVKLVATTGDTLAVDLGKARGFAIENFESFSGKSATGEILGDGWWYTYDNADNLLPLWDKTLTSSYSGRTGCASGGCARTTDRLGFLIGKIDVIYEFKNLDTLYFSAKGSGNVEVSILYDDKGLKTSVALSKVWKSYAIALSKMQPLANTAKDSIIKLNRIDFKTTDTLYLDDVYLGGIDEKALTQITTPEFSFDFPDTLNWKSHDELLAQIEGFGSETVGGKGGSICMVTTTEDYIMLDDSTAQIAPGSLRECAYRDSATWILFEKSGTYNLQNPLRLKSKKTIDGRGREIKITGMGVLTDISSDIIFENLIFTDPTITVRDTTSRRAISIHNETKNVWIDHCTFEKYPLVELDIKRGSNGVTVSWNRFTDGQNAILFGLTPDMFVESDQNLTLHHNYFERIENSGVLSRFGDLHAYNNFFMDTRDYAIECTDSARCLIENNIFTSQNPIDTTNGFAHFKGNWSIEFSLDDSLKDFDFTIPYDYKKEEANANLALEIREKAGQK